MPALAFDQLPSSVQAAVSDNIGRVTGFAPAPVGNHAEIAGTLHTDSERVFVKGTRMVPGERAGGPEAWSLRNEAIVNPHVRPYAPELLWQVETDGWLLTGWEHIEGRHADYTPGSADLDLVADVVEGLGVQACPPVVKLRVENRYTASDEDVSALAGTALLNCDLNPENVLITPSGQARVVDWAFTSCGAAWLETGFLVPWLLRAGHTADQAEGWVARFSSWKAADPAHVDLFVRLLTAQWMRRASNIADWWVHEYAALTRSWASHRDLLNEA